MNRLLQLALWTTVPVNISGAVIFSSPALRAWIGLPAPLHSFYGVLIGFWIFLFGLGSLYLAMTNRYDKTFLCVSAFGKLSFFVLATFYFFRGKAGLLALLASSLDATIAVVFLAYLATKVRHFKKVEGRR